MATCMIDTKTSWVLVFPTGTSSQLVEISISILKPVENQLETHSTGFQLVPVDQLSTGLNWFFDLGL